MEILERGENMEKRIISILMILFLIISLSNCIKSKKIETIKIGVMLPLTGPISFIGENFQMGMLLAYDVCPGKKAFRFLFDDHKNSAKEGVSIFQKYLMQKNMPLIVSTISSVNNSILPLLKKNQRVLIASITSKSNFPDQSEYAFRYFLSTEDEVNKMLEYFEKENINEVGIFYINDEYGLDAKDCFLKSYKGKISFIEAFDKNRMDFKELALKAQKTSSIYILSYGQSYGIFIKQIRELGYKGNIFAFSSFGTPVAIKAAGRFAKNVIFTGTVFQLNTEDNKIKQFIYNYKKKYNKDPDHYSAYGYDIGKIVCKLFEKLTPPYNVKKLRDQILNFKIFEGLFGTSKILLNGDFKFRNVVLYRTDEKGTAHKISFGTK